MKATELRVNNWYNSTKFQTPVICEFADFAELSARADGARVDEDLIDEIFEPIPLTEEWLFKFHAKGGIEKYINFPNEIVIYDRFLFIWKESYKYWYVILEYNKEYLTKIEFVHEYQNFIFALTGEELTIKL